MPKLENLSVTWVSLVKRPANGRSVQLKSGRPLRLVKSDPLLRRVYGIVYAPDSVDSQGDWADAETIRKAADQFLLEGRAPAVDREHSFDPEAAFVAESWIVRSGDPLFPAEPPGAWAVGIQVVDPALWQAAEAGEVEGLSLAGQARLAKRGMLERLLDPFRKNCTEDVTDPQGEESEMTKEEIAALVGAQVAQALADKERAELNKSQREQGEQRIKAVEEGLAALTKAVGDEGAVGKGLKELAAKLEELTKGAPKGAGEGAGGDAGAKPGIFD